MNFEERVRGELAAARRGFPRINSVHEGLAVILEEVREFEAQVFTKPQNRDHQKMLNELVQIAAMCQRTAEDCQLQSNARAAGVTADEEITDGCY